MIETPLLITGIVAIIIAMIMTVVNIVLKLNGLKRNDIWIEPIIIWLVGIFLLGIVWIIG